MDNTERFTAIFREHRVKVAAYARRRASAELAQEIVADTFLAAWRHIDSLPAEPLPWLYRAAAFALANRHRRTSREALLNEPVSDTPELRESDVADTVVTASMWRNALAALTEREREVLLLAAWEQLPPVQAAAVLGCSAVAYRVRLHRARRHLDDLVGTGSTVEAGASLATPESARSDQATTTAKTDPKPTCTSAVSLNIHLKEV